MKTTITILLVALIAVSSVTSRWLPTRSQEDRLYKLRDMLRALLESEIEQTNYDRRALFKREIGPSEQVHSTRQDIGTIVHSLADKTRH